MTLYRFLATVCVGTVCFSSCACPVVLHGVAGSPLSPAATCQRRARGCPARHGWRRQRLGVSQRPGRVETGEPGGLERVHACTERAFALPCQAAGCLIGSLATAFHRGGMGSVTAREGANTGEEAPRPPGAPSSAGGLPRRRGVGKPVAEQSVNEPGRS